MTNRKEDTLQVHLSGSRAAALYDSDTGAPVSPDDLGCSTREYDSAIVESLECPQPEGHVLVLGRRVYAD